jgi:hypothetical protein
LDALAYGEIFLGTIRFHHEETSSFLELWVGADLEEFEIFHLLFMSGVELNDVLHESFVVSSQSLSVLL